MDVIQMFPNEAVDLWVSWNGLVPTILSLIACCRPFDAGVVHKGNSSVQDLGLKDKEDVTIKYCDSTCPSLR